MFEGREGGSVDVDVLYNDERVTKAQTVFVSWGRCVIGSDTLPPYQRRGHSHLAACGSIEQALARGLTPEWYASNSRVSVVRTLDLGFAATRLANVVRVGPGVGMARDAQRIVMQADSARVLAPRPPRGGAW